MTTQELIGIVEQCDRRLCSITGEQIGEYVTSGYIGGLEAMEKFGTTNAVNEHSFVRCVVSCRMADEHRRFHGRRGGIRRATKCLFSQVFNLEKCRHKDGCDEPALTIEPVTPPVEIEDEIEAIAGGDRQAREIIRGRFEGLTDREVGRRLALTEGRISQVRKAVRRKLEQHNHHEGGAEPHHCADSPGTPARNRRRVVSA